MKASVTGGSQTNRRPPSTAAAMPKTTDERDGARQQPGLRLSDLAQRDRRRTVQISIQPGALNGGRSRVLGGGG
jgi:hypothetical protein